MKSTERNASFTRLIDAELIIPVKITGIMDDFFIRREDIKYLDQLSDAESFSNFTSILAPLDNIIWDRRLIKAVFDFEYRWEVYKPAAEREYGYYVLPVLSGDRFVARFEPGFDKKRKILWIKNWWWEKNINQTESLKAGIQDCFYRFCQFLGANQIDFNQKTLSN
jgi:uncharacterized protein YcaQ